MLDDCLSCGQSDEKEEKTERWIGNRQGRAVSHDMDRVVYHAVCATHQGNRSDCIVLPVPPRSRSTSLV